MLFRMSLPHPLPLKKTQKQKRACMMTKKNHIAIPPPPPRDPTKFKSDIDQEIKG